MQKNRQSAILVPEVICSNLERYVQGNVVSKHAQKIIIQFTAANCGTSKKRDNNDVDADENSERTPLPETDVA